MSYKLSLADAPSASVPLGSAGSERGFRLALLTVLADTGRYSINSRGAGDKAIFFSALFGRYQTQGCRDVAVEERERTWLRSSIGCPR
jgi:hypothetical protein